MAHSIALVADLSRLRLLRAMRGPGCKNDFAHFRFTPILIAHRSLTGDAQRGGPFGRIFDPATKGTVETTRGKGVGRHQHHFVSRRTQRSNWAGFRVDGSPSRLPSSALDFLPHRYGALTSLSTLLARTAPLARSLHRRSCCIIAHPARISGQHGVAAVVAARAKVTVEKITSI